MGAAKFNRPIGLWDVSQVTSMVRMFKHARSFNCGWGRKHSATQRQCDSTGNAAGVGRPEFAHPGCRGTCDTVACMDSIPPGQHLLDTGPQKADLARTLDPRYQLVRWDTG